MSSFTENGISVVPPIGSIMSYLGTTSPDGWIICDGARVNNTDSKYQGLISMGIGSKSGTNYTPPDLRSCFLYGSDTDNAIGTTGGNSEINLQHNHSQENGSTTELSVPSNIVVQLASGGNRAGIWTWWQGAQPKYNLSTTNPPTDNSLSTPKSILPPYYSVKYILKY
jgi:microcystin-dependent protein